MANVAPTDMRICETHEEPLDGRPETPWRDDYNVFVSVPRRTDFCVTLYMEIISYTVYIHCVTLFNSLIFFPMFVYRYNMVVYGTSFSAYSAIRRLCTEPGIYFINLFYSLSVCTTYTVCCIDVLFIYLFIYSILPNHCYEFYSSFSCIRSS